MKYKVGDRVQIRYDLNAGDVFGAYFINEKMMLLKGNICTIQDECEVGYKLVEDLGRCIWTDEMFIGEVRDAGSITMLNDFYDPLIETLIFSTSPLEVYNKNKETENKKMKNVDIKNFKIIVPNKVVEVMFTDGLTEKMVCHEDDTFDLRNCLFIALAKHMYKEDYTIEGIEYKANELKLMKKYVKMVDSALKQHKKEEEAIKKAEKEKAAAEATAKRKKEKLAKYKAKCKEKYRQARITEQIEAYVNAMLMYDDIICGCDDCNCEARNCNVDDLK